jgi:dUTP pyrophosphatase
MKKISITKLENKAIIPTRGSTGAAGYDLYTTEFHILKPGERKLFKTGLSMSIPSGMYGRIAPRSGLAYKKGIDVMAGVIDEDYRGEIGVILINLGQEDVNVLIGDKIAQIIFEFYNAVDFVETTGLDNTQRGDGGFGSTDKVENKLNPSVKTFILKKPTTVKKFFEENNAGNVKPEPVEIYLKNYHGEVYEFEESGMKGLCVVDSSGEVHPTSKSLISKIEQNSTQRNDSDANYNQKFTLKKPITVQRFYNENDINPALKLNLIEIHLSQFHGEIHEFVEGNMKGLCVVDQHGKIYPVSKTVLSKIS